MGLSRDKLGLSNFGDFHAPDTSMESSFLVKVNDLSTLLLSF